MMLPKKRNAKTPRAPSRNWEDKRLGDGRGGRENRATLVGIYSIFYILYSFPALLGALGVLAVFSSLTLEK
jgi:hypothetical protein